MSAIQSQLENISKATVPQIKLRRYLNVFAVPATGRFFGTNDCFAGVSENFPKDWMLENNLSGLPETTDHQQSKI